MTAWPREGPSGDVLNEELHAAAYPAGAGAMSCSLRAR
jgi:hypothetical protein